MTIDLIIFDCDGVLVDSEVIANEALRQALGECGLHMTTGQVIEKFVGLSMPSVMTLSEEILDQSLPEDFLSRLQDKTFAAFEEALAPVQGIHGVLTCLSNKAQKICVASNGSLEKMDFTLGLTGLKDFFQGNIFSSSHVKRGKPYPDLYLYAAAQMGCDPSQCLVVEDSLPGVQAAVAAGMEVLAYSVRGQDHSLATAGGMLITHMNDVVKYLKE